MKKLLVALGGFAFGAVIIIAAAQSAGTSQGPTASPAKAVSMSTAAPMTGGGAQASDVQLRIVHVLRGCHVWRDGQRQAATMRITLPRNGRLSIVDQDVDAHQLMQAAGPRLHMPGAMSMMSGAQMRFTRPGTYRLTTKTVDLPGRSMPEINTVGPDNHLALMVTVT